MWKKYVSSISKDYQFKAPATKNELQVIQEELNVELPMALAELYSETNGVYGDYGVSYIWSTQQLVKENMFFRTLHEYRDSMMPLHNFLFFSDAGNGDLFGYSLLNGRVHDDNIYVWNHEDDSRIVIASSLEEFIEGWFTGRISV